MSRRARGSGPAMTLLALGVGLTMLLPACASAVRGDSGASGSLIVDESALALDSAGLRANLPSTFEQVEGGRDQQQITASEAAPGDDQPDADPPDELAFASPLRFGLGPGMTIEPPPAQPATAFSAGLLAGNQAAGIARTAQVAGAQVDYWGDTHSVVLTINHALVTAPAAGWLTPAIDQVSSIAQQVWGSESATRFGDVGLDWEPAAPSLVIIDEANNAELLCGPATMRAFASGEVAITAEGLASSCQ